MRLLCIWGLLVASRCRYSDPGFGAQYRDTSHSSNYYQWRHWTANCCYPPGAVCQGRRIEASHGARTKHVRSTYVARTEHVQSTLGKTMKNMIIDVKKIFLMYFIFYLRKICKFLGFSQRALYVLCTCSVRASYVLRTCSVRLRASPSKLRCTPPAVGTELRTAQLSLKALLQFERLSN